MMNGDYWARRFELLTDMELNKGEQFYGDLQRQYTKSIRRMQKDASYYLQKMADANGLSMTEARKLLKKDELEEFHWSVEEYIQRGRENAVDQSWMVELQNASTKFHVSRLEALQTQMRAEVEQLTGGQSEDLKKLLEGIYEDDYYRTAFEVQKGTGVGFQMMRLDKRSVEKAVLKPWTTDDQTFSDRLWKNKQTLLNNLQSGLSQAIAQGKNPSEVTDMISQKMGVSKSQAGRLVMTESAFIASSAQKDSFKELGVEEYEVVATLDTKTSDVCRAMDGKHFPMSQYQIGVTAPPFHPWCRSTTVPFFDDEFTVGEQRAMRDPKTGDYSTVSSNMKYEEWYEKFVVDEEKKAEEIKAAEEVKKAEADPIEAEISVPTKEAETEINSDDSDKSEPEDVIIEPDTRTYKRADEKDYSRMAKAHAKNTSKEDAAQIHRHTKQDGSTGGYVATENYSTINSNLRSDSFTGNQLDTDDIETIEAMRRAIAQNELDDDYILTRYVNADYLTSVFGMRGAKYEGGIAQALGNTFVQAANPHIVNVEIPRITKELQQLIGSEIPPDGAFLSTSLLHDHNVMQNKAVLFEIHAPKETHCYIPKNKRESECILGEGQRMLIENVEFSALARKWIFTVRLI